MLEEKPRITDEQADPALKVEDGSIRFDHVYFKYHDTAEAWNLEDVALPYQRSYGGHFRRHRQRQDHAGEHDPRLYDVNGGAVYVGGHNVKNYTMEALRDGCAMVLQKNTLFSGTIRENLRWGDENASDQEIEDACRLACADRFIENAGRIRHLYRTGRHQRLRRAEAAAVHRPGGAAKPKMRDPGRLHQRGGHRHGRTNPGRAETRRCPAAQSSSSPSGSRLSWTRILILVMDDGHISAIGTHES